LKKGPLRKGGKDSTGHKKEKKAASSTPKEKTNAKTEKGKGYVGKKKSFGKNSSYSSYVGKGGTAAPKAGGYPVI